MKEKTQSSVVVNYAIWFIVFSIIIIGIVDVLYITLKLDVWVRLIEFILFPVISALLASKVVLGRTKILLNKNKNIKKQFLISEIIAFVVSYFMYTSAVNLVSVILYLVLCFISSIIANRALNKALNNSKEPIVANNSDNSNINIENNPIKTNDTNNVNILNPINNASNSNVMVDNDTNSNIIKQYELDKFNNDAISKFLNKCNLDSENYFLAIGMPSMGSYALMGGFAGIAKMVNYIITYDLDNIYMFELSRLTNKVIENCIIVKREDIEDISVKSGMFGIVRKINIKLKNKTKYNLQANKKTILKNQEKAIENLLMTFQK